MSDQPITWAQLTPQTLPHWIREHLDPNVKLRFLRTEDGECKGDARAADGIEVTP